MKTLLKTVMIPVGLLLLAIAVATLLASTQIEDMIRSRLQDRITHILGTDLRVANINILPARLGIELQDLTIKNPPEFKQGDVLLCHRILVRPDWRTLFSRTIVIKEIILNGMAVNLRYKVGEGTNLGYVRKQAAALAETQPPQPGGRMLLVKAVRSGTIDFHISSILTAELPLALHVEPFTLNNVGEGQPISTAKLASIITRSLMMEALTLKGILRPAVNLLRDEIQ
ncbi:MAG TPA: AsmA family protein [Candidatus Hydrogenedentes bacterium]|nr:AsmA family protein [Candidatus Hydrogenedentota bacterium]